MLKAAAGVYLITTETGAQYVGAAYGGEGFLGRWRAYTKTGHGGNKQLMVLLDEHPGAEAKFQFSILRTLPIGSREEDVIAAERTLKNQLGTRAHGLNSN